MKVVITEDDYGYPETVKTVDDLDLFEDMYEVPENLAKKWIKTCEEYETTKLEIDRFIKGYKEKPIYLNLKTLEKLIKEK